MNTVVYNGLIDAQARVGRHGRGCQVGHVCRWVPVGSHYRGVVGRSGGVVAVWTLGVLAVMLVTHRASYR